MANKPKTSPGTIAQNKKARFEYELHERFEEPFNAYTPYSSDGYIQLTPASSTRGRPRKINSRAGLSSCIGVDQDARGIVHVAAILW